jgi:hypothetical protein
MAAMSWFAPPAAVTAAVAALAASALLAGCSTEQPAEGPSSRAVEAPPVSPLTGRPVEGDPEHPVVTVKVDNSTSSAPQVGLAAADMVVEELVEGGITRLAALYYSEIPERVGPVRSMRATDIGIVKPLGAVLVASGGAPKTVVRVAAAGIATVTEEAEGFYREAGRPMPYNLFLELPEVVDGLEATAAPAPYLPFGDGPLPAGDAARAFTVTFSPSSSSSFEHRDGRYVSTTSRAGTGDEYVADTVLVLEVQVRDAGYLDPSGSFVPESRFDGRGHARIFHGGRVVEADWIKEGLGAPVELLQGDRALTIPPGNVWVELVPADTGGVSIAG